VFRVGRASLLAVVVAVAIPVPLAVTAPPALAAPVAPSTVSRDVPLDDQLLQGVADAATPGYPVATCGWNDSLARNTSADGIMAGSLKIPKFADHQIGTGPIDWTADPYRNRTWRLWFGSLKWAERLLSTYAANGDRAYLERARDIARDFVDHNPDPGTNTLLWKGHAISLRTSFLLCLEQHTGREPWLDAAIDTHATILNTPSRYAGPYNHGIMQNTALLGVACLRNRADWRATAVSRQTTIAKKSFDAEGVSEEQAPGYTTFIWSLWKSVLDYHRQCGAPVLDGLEPRLAKVHEFMAHATAPDGTMVTIGDTARTRVSPQSGSWARYMSTLGETGTAPGPTVAVYRRGYVFGRTGWGTARPFAQEQQYSVRFGPGRIVHGHDDHLGVTFYSGGRHVLVDSGFKGYSDTVYDAWTRSPEAHSVPVLPGVAFNIAAATPLTKSGLARGVRSFEFTDRAYAGTTRRRTVAVAENGGPMLVRDDVSTDRGRRMRMLWHLDESWRLERTYNWLTQSQARFLSPDGRQRAWVVQMGARGETLPRTATVIVKGQQRPLQGWMDAQVAAPVVEAQRYGQRVTALTAIVVLPADQKLVATRKRFADGKETITLTAGHARWVFRTSASGGIWGG
jgi:hypothetical protein